MAKLHELRFRNFKGARVIGKSSSSTLGGDNPIPAHWTECFGNDTFEILKNMDPISNSYVGWIGDFDSETRTFTYIAGMMMAHETPVPEGYDFRDLPACKMAIAWIKGTEPEIYHDAHTLTEKGINTTEYRGDFSCGYAMEVYDDKRFGKAMEKGKKQVILDYYIPCIHRVSEYYSPGKEPNSRVRKLFTSLYNHKIAKKTIDQIMEGAGEITKNTKRDTVHAWLSDAMGRLDDLLPLDVKKATRESCACCLGGKRLKLSKGIAEKGGTIAERIAIANKTPLVFGDSVTLEDDGTVTVRFSPEGKETYQCVCLRTAMKMSTTYCMCCGGHIKHHLQIALEKNLDCRIVHTPLTTLGKKPCTMSFTIVDG